jgi:hypothetical protein
MRYVMRNGWMAFLLGVAMVGCGPKEDPGTGNTTGSSGANASGESTEEEGGFNIQFPGGSVKLGKDGGVNVEAPGVKVDTKPGEKVKVEAGGVDVDVDLGGKADSEKPKDEDSAGIMGNGSQAGQEQSIQMVAYRPQVGPAGFDDERVSVFRIPAGTKFDETPPENWTNIISFVEGRLASGDVDKTSETMRYYARLFNIVMLANVVKGDAGTFELDKVGMGFSMKIDGMNTVVTSDTQKELGGKLSMIGRSVLDGNVDSLDKVFQVARNQTSMVIDAPAVMLRDGEHREMTVRYLVWVSPADGRLGTVAWLLDQDGSRGATNEAYKIAEDTVQFLPANFHEERIMNVKGDQINFMGIPSKEAFALAQTPQGKAYKYTDALRDVAGLRTYDQQSYLALLAAMSKALATPQ